MSFSFFLGGCWRRLVELALGWTCWTTERGFAQFLFTCLSIYFMCMWVLVLSLNRLNFSSTYLFAWWVAAQESHPTFDSLLFYLNLFLLSRQIHQASYDYIACFVFILCGVLLAPGGSAILLSLKYHVHFPFVFSFLPYRHLSSVYWCLYKVGISLYMRS